MPQRLKYREENINLIRTSVENNIKTNPEYGYSVKVSGFMVIPRTRDLSLFDSFADHVTEDTDVVVFTNYFSRSNPGDTITLYVSDEALYAANNKNAGLSGTNSGLKGLHERSEIRQQIYFELQNDFLKKENEQLKEEVAEAKKVMREVEVFVAQVRQQSAKVKDKGLLELISSFATRIAVAKPELFKEIPVLDALVSMLPANEEKALPSAEPVNGSPEVTIKPKQEERDPETKRLVMLLKELRRNFSEIEFEACTELLGTLGKNKELLPYVNQWLEEQLEKKRQWIERQTKVFKVQEQTNDTEPEEEKREPEIGNEQRTKPKNDYPDYEDDPVRIFHQ